GRRHTRLVSDWSSDVCSSDLHLLRRREIGEEMHLLLGGFEAVDGFPRRRGLGLKHLIDALGGIVARLDDRERRERERREPGPHQIGRASWRGRGERAGGAGGG